MSDKEKIRECLEKKMYSFNLSADIASSEDYNLEKIEDAKYQLCKEILQFIDSLSEEPVSENLAEAWGKAYEEEEDEILVAYDYYTGFVAGVNWLKEKTIRWLTDFNNEHEIISHTDSHTLETDELVNYFKNYMES